jgi:hypothetical protein
MGGYGSGFRGVSKRTVEGCLTLSAGKLMTLGKLKPNFSTFNGSLTWTNTHTSEALASIGIDTDAGDDSGTVRLHYTRKNAGESVDYSVRIVATPLPWGGVRWWFICPLVVNERPCGRRVGKLYLPGGGKYFGCRHCYNLTYTSCQESHKYDSCLGAVGAPMGLSAREVGKLLKQAKW